MISRDEPWNVRTRRRDPNADINLYTIDAKSNIAMDAKSNIAMDGKSHMAMDVKSHVKLKPMMGREVKTGNGKGIIKF